MDMITSFGGYNHNLSISDGEFYDMENLSSDKFPLVSVRNRRASLGYPDSGGTTEWLIAENDGIYAFYVGVRSGESNAHISVKKYDETEKYWDTLGTYEGFDQDIELDFSINMGAQIIIFPAKILYNTVNSTIKQLENTTQIPSGSSILGVLVDHNGNSIPSYTAGTLEPTEPGNGDYWLDKSAKTYVLKRYSEASGMWATVQTYVRLSGLANAYEEGDALEVIGSQWDNYFQKAENQKYWTVYKKETSPNNYIQLPVTPKGTTRSYEFTSLTLKRTVPEFDYITECNNRLWACRYGNDDSNKPVNEIFACKLGDPTNWHYFANTAIDSYYMSLGTGGRFTGAITYQSNPIFFKEDSVHRVYGNYPSNFQLKTIMGYGVQYGSDRSVAELNDTVYYLSNAGIVAYRGSVPVTISERFGTEKYKNGKAASAGNKYYI
jgi:hypothetical protein